MHYRLLQIKLCDKEEEEEEEAYFSLRAGILSCWFSLQNDFNTMGLLTMRAREIERVPVLITWKHMKLSPAVCDLLDV